jgi:hypothetical protein
MNGQVLLAMVGGVVLAGAITWMVLVDESMPRPSRAAYRGPEFRTYSAAMPPIDGFEGFNVNELNPFVPWHERNREEQRVRQPPAKPAIRVRPPPEIKVKEPPKYNPPRKSEGGGQAPLVRAIVARNSSSAAIVDKVLIEFPGSTTTKTLGVGESAEGWTLVGIEHGTLVVLRDQNGRDFRFTVGDGKP